MGLLARTPRARRKMPSSPVAAPEPSNRLAMSPAWHPRFHFESQMAQLADDAHATEVELEPAVTGKCNGISSSAIGTQKSPRFGTMISHTVDMSVDMERLSPGWHPWPS